MRSLTLMLCALLVVLAAVAGGIATAQTRTPDVVVIVHPDAVGEIDAAQLRAIYTMRLRQWPDGQPLRVFALPDGHPTHARFAEQSLRILPHLLRRSWDRLVFSGTGQAPTEVASEAQMIERVAMTPGAIGYVTGGHPGLEAVRVIQPEAKQTAAGGAP